jgi:hypothetical protein
MIRPGLFGPVKWESDKSGRKSQSPALASEPLSQAGVDLG